ncbi:MAG: hypothetical protein LPK92_05715, partial [Actinomycetes bacterium]|nr:hypothetical protein [Actinomycetes bacterium]MDX5399203.1 hypothetical protein [Actinomycetes bacterium]
MRYCPPDVVDDGVGTPLEVGTCRDHEGDREPLGERKQVLEQQARRRVGPVDVLQHQHQGAVAGDTFDHLTHHLERSELKGLGGEIEPRGLFGLELDPQHRPEIRIQPLRGGRQDLVQAGVEGDP